MAQMPPLVVEVAADVPEALAALSLLRRMIEADERWEDPLQAAHLFVSFVAEAREIVGGKPA